jgi:magnesium transporter
MFPAYGTPRRCEKPRRGALDLVPNQFHSIRAILDANRNSLMLLDLKFSVGTLGLATGTFIAGLYGMNLENFIEHTNYGFGAVTGTSVVLSVFICWYGLVKLRKVQRVKMGGSGSSKSHGSSPWLRGDGTDLLLDPGNRERLRRMKMLHHPPKPKKWLF